MCCVCPKDLGYVWLWFWKCFRFWFEKSVLMWYKVKKCFRFELGFSLVYSLCTWVTQLRFLMNFASHVYYLVNWLIIILVIYYIHSLEFSPQTNVHNDAEIPEISDKTESESVSAEDRTGRWARVTFKIVLSYHGGSFDGWQKQPGLNTVQR